MITIIHPSRERAEIAKKIYDEWLFHADKHFEYYLCIEPDQENDYLKYFKPEDLFISDSMTAIEAINNGAKHAYKKGFDLLVVISDDFHCFDKWDIKIERKVEKYRNFVLKTFDGIHDWLVTLPIMDKEYYETYGYVYPPCYKHMFADTDLTSVAQYTDRLLYANDLKFLHKQFKDDLYDRNNKTWAEGEKTYLERYKNDFGVKKLKGITDLNHNKWLKTRV